MIQLVLTVTFFNLNECARILAVFPTASLSHQYAYRPITQELAKRGHEVIIVTTDPAFEKGQAPENLREIDVHEISYRYKDLEKYDGHSNQYTRYKKALSAINFIFSKQIEVPELKKLIDDKVKFDLILVEACVSPALVFSYLFKAPMILVSSSGSTFNYETMGAPTHELLYPSCMRTRVYNLTMWEKITEIVKVYAIKYLFYNSELEAHEILKKHFGKETPSIHELRYNVDMLFLNIHPIWEGVRPTPPNVVYMGGVHEYSKTNLSQDLQNFLDASNGTIYVSFGTNVDTSVLRKDIVEAMVNVFSKLPYSVLWKWDEETLPGQTENIKISVHFPQAKLLSHPKTILFITQGGLHSTDEAINAGVPLIGIPFAWDQWYNVEKYIHHGIGEKIERELITEDVLRDTIERVLGNESYRQNINRLRELMNDQPQKPLDRAIWWSEYVIRHSGARHLRLPTTNATWSDNVELELILLVLSAILLLVCSISCVIYVMCRWRKRKLKFKLP